MTSLAPPAKTIATICARGGSKGLPGKNIRPFMGVPLIVHTIRHALGCEHVDGVYVSTDDDQIAEIARDAGAMVPFKRPAELATDTAGKLPVIEHIARFLELQGETIVRIVDLQPTSPLRDAADIEMALQTRPDAELVVSVAEAHDNPYFNVVELGTDGMVRLCAGEGNLRRQDAPQVYALNGSIYVWHRAALAKAVKQGMWSVRMAPYVMPRWKSVDIDTIDDFDYAEWLYVRHRGGDERG